MLQHNGNPREQAPLAFWQQAKTASHKHVLTVRRRVASFSFLQWTLKCEGPQSSRTHVCAQSGKQTKMMNNIRFFIKVQSYIEKATLACLSKCFTARNIH
jgi:hypothetical protein